MGSSESWASSDAVRRSMQGNRARDTKPEMHVRRATFARGLRYRVDLRPLPDLNRRADLVFPRLKIAVFVDGCFWHGCPDHHTVSKTNPTFWAEKVNRNRDRDAETTEVLRQAGWLVLRFWEHDDPEEAARRIEEAVAQRRERPTAI